jgi:energy-coupling factor transporter ATP-binding protein EcfA2
MANSVKELKDIIKTVPLKRAGLSENESLNDIYQQSGSAGVLNLIQNAEGLEEVEPVAQTNVLINAVVLSKEEATADWNKQADNFLNKNDEITEQKEVITITGNETLALEILHENKLLFKTANNHFYILGSIAQDLSSLKVTLLIEELSNGRKERTKIDLYERESLRLFSQQLADAFNQHVEIVESELLQLTDLLEKFREKQFEQSKTAYKQNRHTGLINPEQKQICLDFLKQPDLIEQIDKLIETAGVVGEERTRKLLFIIASTYKMTSPLHALVQGSSGSGKSHLINIIGQCLPPEDVMSITRVTSKSFYHYNKDELVDKLMLIQDFDGLDEEAQYAFRELQSAGNISSSTTYKDRSGNIISMIKLVRSHFASLLATTKAEVYYDSMSRSLIIGIDECEQQTKKIIEYQNKRLAGLIDIREEQKAKEFLQNCIRCIKPMEVVNRYADKIALPMEAKMLRRLNSHYQGFVKQVTILHQHQRQKDEQGRLIAEPEDLKMACDILFDAIMLKVDDLDSSLRQFFDRMKVYVKQITTQTNKPQTETVFTQREIRLALNASKSQCFRFMEDLELLEYIQKTGGYANKGFKYKIVFWDDMESIREKIKTDLNKQLAELKNETSHAI